MHFKLIEEMKEIPPFLLKDKIVKPYFFKEVKESSIKESVYKSYIVVLKYNNYMLLNESLVPPTNFLQQLLERYLPEALIDNIKIVLISEHPRQKYPSEIFSLILQPYTTIRDSKFRSLNLLNRVLKKIEVWLQIIKNKSSYRELESFY